ncbi:thiol-disulfide isomerase/thioredoxin [Ichthyenterobacterium magnum]|uniref:Thiol-disulfide isomerase/thioredoxin n=2 Tax=Ichthyenterobacterium magnum TaxID=1230530 RepID=A0A420DGF6_9FLAO|nr:thiol-disulfide isomerase/thioredoxin [Ichthyenterobacterium magnum]
MKRSNIIFLIVIALLLIPQTRLPIQVFIHKGLAMFSPSIKSELKDKITFSNWELKSLDGKRINFKNLEGKVVFLNFWATWCPPCIAELPQIQELYNDYNDKVEFVIVSNEKRETIQKFLDRKGYELETYISLSIYPEKLTISSIPRTFLIDKEGTIVIDKNGAANWNSDEVRSLIDKLLF